MKPVVQNPEKLKRLADLKARVAELEITRPSDWYCDNPNCNGLPHGRWKKNHARAKQRPPAGDWFIWLMMTGRGFGKTMSGANWLIESAREVISEYAVVAPTWRDVRLVCAQGPSGILANLREGELVDYNKGSGDITLRNGSIIHLASADQPDRLRGYNIRRAWCDEVSSWRYPSAWHEGLIPSIRIGPEPRVLVTTTPKMTLLMLDLVKRAENLEDEAVTITTGSMWENADNLSESAMAELQRRYAGTRIGKQELEGLLLSAVEGSVTSLDKIADGRVKEEDVPDLVRIVVAVDPAVTSGEDSDSTGIIVMGKGTDGHGYVLADYTIQGVKPDKWAKRAIAAYRLYEADRIVAEVNNGGDMIAFTIGTVDPRVPIQTVRATRGKRVRAEPVSALYEQERIHHVGEFADLETQLCTWTTESPQSPDNLDALVWACYALGLTSSGDWSQLFKATVETQKELEAPKAGSWANIYYQGERNKRKLPVIEQGETHAQTD